MENASKALIMAGAILIAILLISIGIRVLNSTSGLADEVNSQSSTVAAQMFNAKITPYLGNSIEGAKVRALISYIITVDSSENKPVYIYYVSTTEKEYHTSKAQYLQEIYNDITTLSNYKVYVTSDCHTYTNGGYKSDGTIGCITIKKL